MERQKSTSRGAVQINHSLVNGHYGGGKKRPCMDSEGSARKKKKGEFLKGSIVRIRLHNFLTFDDIELYPGPGLNVIVGPNGTGKSSIVCGICLGLAGHPKLLGRAKELKDFVKYSKPKAFTEIELFNPSGSNPLIRREINRDTNNSLWILNGKSCQMKEVQKVVSDMNVQLSNKCQFLPQDMVVEFARMNSYQVLEETEKAVGTTDMFELHQKLKNMKSSHKDIYNSLKEKEEMLEKKTRENELIQSDVDRLRDREHALACIKILKEKKCWMLYEAARAEYLDMKKKSKKAESRWRKAQNDNKPLEDQLKRLDVSINSCSEEEQNNKKKVTDKQRDVKRSRDTLNQLEDEVERPREELENKKKQERQRQNKLSRTKAEIDEMEHQLASFIPEDTVKAQLAEKTEQLKEIGRMLHDVQQKQQEIMEQKRTQVDQKIKHQEELRKVRDVRNRRLEVLRQENKSCYDVVQWLHNHQDLFQYPIIEPLILVANCRDPQYLKQVESFLNNKDKFSFTAQTKDDMTMLRREVREKLHISVNIVLDPKCLDTTSDISRFTPFTDINNMRQYGFEQWMVDLIDAPPPVLRVLCKYHYLHYVLVAKELLPDQITRIVNNVGDRVRNFYTSSENVSVTVSKHGNRVKSVRQRYLENPVYLGNMLDDSRVRQIQQQIRDAEDKIKTFDEPLADLEQQEKKLRRDDETIRQEKTDLAASKREKAKISSTIRARRTRLTELENTHVDIEAAEEECKEAIMRVQHNRVQSVKKIANNFEDLVNRQNDHTVSLLKHQTVIVEREGIQKRFADLKHCLEEAQTQYNEAKRLTEVSKDKAKHCLAEAHRLSGVTNPNDITPEKQAQYNSYPDDLGQIEERIHEYQTRTELCHTLDTGLIEQFELRRAEIDELQQEVGELQARFTGHNEQVEEMKNKWLGPLKSLISQVDQKFSSFFNDMGCAGEVSLQEDKDNDFSKYGIAIKVKFRPNEELQVLSTSRQSGGERSVSTMLYLMALQDITSCPFRAVDEINQGMDPINERRVFNLIVSVVNKPNSSQYFLLTPKLLTDLNYTASVRVHCICNGVEMNPFQHWKIRKFLDTASSIYEEEEEEQ